MRTDDSTSRTCFSCLPMLICAPQPTSRCSEPSAVYTLLLGFTEHDTSEAPFCTIKGAHDLVMLTHAFLSCKTLCLCWTPGPHRVLYAPPTDTCL